MFCSQAQSEVADGKGVGVAQPAHGNHLCGPRSDAGQRQQLVTGRVPVAAGVKDHTAIGQPSDQGGQGALTSPGDGQVGGIDVGKLLDRWEGVRQRAVRGLKEAVRHLFGVNVVPRNHARGVDGVGDGTEGPRYIDRSYSVSTVAVGKTQLRCTKQKTTRHYAE